MTTQEVTNIGTPLLVIIAWLLQHWKGAKRDVKLDNQGQKLDVIQKELNGGVTLLIRQKAIDKRRIAAFDPTPENIAEAEAAEAAVHVREDGAALNAVPVNPKTLPTTKASPP